MMDDHHHHLLDQQQESSSAATTCPFLLLKKQAKQQQEQRSSNKKSRSRRKPQQEVLEEEDMILDDEDVINAFVLFNQNLSSKEYCKDKVQMNRDHTRLFKNNCNSLKILHHNEPFCAAVGEYQAYFAGQKREVQQMIAIDWMRICAGIWLNAQKNSPLYPIPFLAQPPGRRAWGWINWFWTFVGYSADLQRCLDGFVEHRQEMVEDSHTPPLQESYSAKSQEEEFVAS